MPNRILKESICTSDSIESLNWFEEVLFYRLIVNCDDYGRFDGRPSIVKNRLFPLKENLTVKTVSGAINKLASAGLVTLYVFEGKPYLYLPTWNHHQSVRAKRSKYPAPEDGCLQKAERESICKQMISDDSICPRNPIQSESESESESNARTARSDGFERFWAIYPKKVGKQAALKAWNKQNPGESLVEAMLSAIETQKKSAQWVKDGGQFIPNPATWLNQERWNDELPQATRQEIPKGASGELGDAELEAIRRVLADG